MTGPRCRNSARANTCSDHCFELPHKNLEAENDIQVSVEAGTVTHKLKVGGNDKMRSTTIPASMRNASMA